MNHARIAAVLAGLIVATPVSGQNIINGNPAVAPLIEEDEGAAPKPIDGVAISYRAPPRDTTGAYITPNRDLSPEETTWHLRVALNVAALGCRDADEKATVAAYNAMLVGEGPALASALTGMAVRYQAKFGPRWQSMNDDNMTRLYNFFAQTPAKSDFCAAAKAVLAEVAAIEPAQFATFAAAALPRLEAPFLIFFARHDAYRFQLADWQERHQPKAAIALTALIPVVGVNEGAISAR